MQSIRARLQRLSSKLGLGRPLNHLLVWIGTEGAAVVRCAPDDVNCYIPEPTEDLAFLLAGCVPFFTLGRDRRAGTCVGDRMGGPEPTDMEPDEAAALREAILAAAVDDEQRRLLAGVGSWTVLVNAERQPGWEARHGIEVLDLGDGRIEVSMPDEQPAEMN